MQANRVLSYLPPIFSSDLVSHLIFSSPLSPPSFSSSDEREKRTREERGGARCCLPCPCSCLLPCTILEQACTYEEELRSGRFLPCSSCFRTDRPRSEKQQDLYSCLLLGLSEFWCSSNPCMDGKELISPSDHLPPFYAQHHRMLAGAGAGGGHNPSPLAGMPSVIRPMPNMNMSPTAILQSIGGGSLGGMQFQMDAAPPPPPLLQNSMGSFSGSVPAASPTEPVKRKRGRPRKYGPDGTMKASAAAQQQMVSAPPSMGSMSGADMVGNSGLGDSAQKKRRGRPPGTGKKQPLSQLSSPVGNAFSGSAGTSFTPHIITASPSEDVAGKIGAFASRSSRAVCVLSATGSVSRVILRNPADASSMSGVHNHTCASYKNPAIYEGLYEILSLSGSYNLNEGAQNQSDGLSVTLCSPERHVIGGVLGGALVAASTVQVVLGSFLHGGSRSKSKKAGKQPAFSSDSLAGGQDGSPSSGHNKNITPPSVTGGWPSSGIFDARSSNIDINSSRG